MVQLMFRLLILLSVSVTVGETFGLRVCQMVRLAVGLTVDSWTVVLMVVLFVKMMNGLTGRQTDPPTHRPTDIATQRAAITATNCI